MPSTTATISIVQVFENGEDGIACFRIPAIVRLITGELLAVAEARIANCHDHDGPIRLVAKIGDPTGETWSKPIYISQNVLPNGEEQVAQNPSMVVDLIDPEHPGKVIMLFNKAEHGERGVTEQKSVRRFFAIESLDNGRTWVNERDITSEVHRPNLPTYTRVHADAAKRYNDPDDWRATFPPVGHGIQLQGGASGDLSTRGRLVFSTYITQGDRTILQGQAHLVYSDDHGKTWVNGDPSPVIGVNEMMAVEDKHGDVLVNFRSYVNALTPNNDKPDMSKGRGQYTFRTRPDGSYEVPTSHKDYPDLPMPPFGLQGAIHRLNPMPVGPVFYTGCDNTESRKGLAVFRSDDEGESWEMFKRIDPGPSAYSDLVTLEDGRLGIIYETGGDDGIVFGAINI